MRCLRNDRARLMILTLAHFSVDFCGGLTIPLPEPTLVQHLGVSLPRVALLLGGCAIIVNAVQPICGWLLPARGMPIVLAAGPAAAALITCLGLTHSYAMTAAMLFVGGIGIGILHPEGALAAHAVAGKHKGLGVSIFMSGGYFGYASGSLAAGVWVERMNQDITHFWVLALPALLATALVFASGLHRLEGHVVENESATTSVHLPFPHALALAVSIAWTLCTFVRFVTIWLVRRFPDGAAQGWGGTAVFATGLFGALGGIMWGHLSDRIGRGRVIALAQLLCIPFLFMALRVTSPQMVPVWGIGIGLTAGGVFPLSVVLAREAKGLSQRMRMGLAIGGAWGLAEIAFILGSRYISAFPVTAHEPVRHVLNMCWGSMAVTAMLALLAGKRK